MPSFLLNLNWWNFFQQPINILILIQQVINHISSTIILLSVSISLALGSPISNIIDEHFGDLVSGNTYCWTFYHSLSLNFIYQGIDGIGISIIRLLYIKKGTWVKYKFGEFKLLCVIGLLNGFVTMLLLYWYSIENLSNRSIYNVCMGHSQKFQVTNSLLFIVITIIWSINQSYIDKWK